MIAAVILAAGHGVRMTASPNDRGITGLRKQYQPLCGKPVLSHCLDHFLAYPGIDLLVVVLPRDEISFGLSLLPGLDQKDERIRIIAGGDHRQASVYNGLAAIPTQEGIVLIHDGVRPLISRKLIEACIQGARQFGACIPAVSMADTPKQVNENGMVTGTVPRQGLWLAQTPQAFKLSLIRSAHKQAAMAQYQATDDAALVEGMGGAVKVIPGMKENIKITTPEDMQLAAAYLTMAAKRGNNRKGIQPL